MWSLLSARVGGCITLLTQTGLNTVCCSCISCDASNKNSAQLHCPLAFAFVITKKNEVKHSLSLRDWPSVIICFHPDLRIVAEQ